MKKSSSKK